VIETAGADLAKILLINSHHGIKIKNCYYPPNLRVNPMDAKIQHLQMIQGVINRLANSSFLLKGWSVILVSALFALAAKDVKIYFIYLAYFPAIAFWGLDGYFLRQERLFRKLYDKIRDTDSSNIDFSMNTAPVVNQVDSWFSVTISKTLNAFHGVIVGTIILVMCIVIFLI